MPYLVKVVLVAAFGAAVAAMTGCSSSSSEAVPTLGAPSSSTSTTSSSPLKSEDGSSGLCTEDSLLEKMPTGSSIQTYKCALGSPYMWAAVQVKGSPKVYFMRSNGPWSLVKTSEACGSGKGRAPKELSTMCPTT